MNETVIVAIFSLIGTLSGTFGGILTSSKLTNYRLQQLEIKVDEHNGFGRIIPVLQEQVKALLTEVSELSAEVKRLRSFHEKRDT